MEHTLSTSTVKQEPEDDDNEANCILPDHWTNGDNIKKEQCTIKNAAETELDIGPVKVEQTCTVEMMEEESANPVQAMQPTNKRTLPQLWSTQSEPKEQNQTDILTTATNTMNVDLTYHQNTNENSTNTQKPDGKTIFEACVKKNYYPKTAQDQLRTEIDIINSELIDLYKTKNCGQISEAQERYLKAKEKQKAALEKSLTKKLNAQKRQQKFRENKRKNLAVLCEEHPELKKALKMRDGPGRPKIEESQPRLLEAIVNLAMHGSPAHERRQEESLRSNKSLRELTTALKQEGFVLSKSALYLRLLPKRSISLEGKKHVQTVPVSLRKAQKDAHFKHMDENFCKATINHLGEIASMLGPNEVCFLNQDDKSRIPIGLTAANHQSPIVMHVEYKISLPDHDWVVADKHKLIPSVYAGIVIQPNGNGDISAIGYSGPTFIAIRSGKHSSSTAYSHALDFETILTLEEFDVVTKFKNNVKPIVIITVDGGPDENPRYQKVIDIGMHNFLTHDLDALFIAANAPGRSAFNRVERRMAPLSRELAGLVLPHEHYGSHLNSNRQTIDLDLEKQNFRRCGETLADLWNAVEIDKYPTVAKYIDPEYSEIDRSSILSKDEVWISRHVRTSQYFTQIVKCNDLDCCSKPRSSLFNIMPERFLSPPLALEQSDQGLTLSSNILTNDSCKSKFVSNFVSKNLKLQNMASVLLPEILPYDFHCPSVQEELKDRTCKSCKIYFASKVMLEKHQIVHKKNKNVIFTEKKARPVYIAAKRQRELMVILKNDQVEWLDEDNLDLTNMSLIRDDEADGRLIETPISGVEMSFHCPWENA